MRFLAKLATYLLLGLALVNCIDKQSSPTAETNGAKATEPAPQLSRFEQFKKSADGGDARAMFQISKMYSAGTDVGKDKSLADSYLKKSVEANHPDAVYKLAEDKSENLTLDWLIEGNGNDEKFRNAQIIFTDVVQLYSKALELGIAKANIDLGFLYLNGLNKVADSFQIPPSKFPKEFVGNVDRALPYFEKTADLGMPRSMVALYRLHSVPKYRHVNDAVAAGWFKKITALSTREDLSVAADHLYYGLLAREGGFTAIDDFKPEQTWVKEALPLLERAADAGDRNSQVLLGRIFLNGFGGYKDAAAAAKYLEQAAASNDIWSQVALGRLYMSGSGVFQDYSAAWKVFAKAANAKEFDIYVWEAQTLLGVLLEKGLGVPKDMVLAHAWYNIAATNSFKNAVPRRDAVTLRLSAEEITEAQVLAKNWKPGVELERGTSQTPRIPQAGGPATKKVGTGTMFYINTDGMAMTNSHVVASCKEVKVEGSRDLAKVVTQDTVNDLALVQVTGGAKQHATIVADPGKTRQGQDVIVFGFPLNSVLSSGGNLTLGVVSALTGLGNNTNQIQITAPIQPGSSGSPVLNKNGEVVGVVSMKLSDSKMVKATGQIGQNVNFAVSGQTLKSFLDAHKVDYSTGGMLSLSKITADLADDAKKWTTVVECWK